MTAQRWIFAAAVGIGLGYAWLSGAFVGAGSSPEPVQASEASSASQAPPAPLPEGLARATFASGCFWCTEADFDKVQGVVSTRSGYTGGRTPNPTYRQVSSGGTGHAEAVEVIYDPRIVSYEALLDHYWTNVDPFTANRQFCDVGSQYRPEIFVHTDAQRRAAEASKGTMQKRFSGQPIVVVISDAGAFYPAEDYHQDYYQKNSAQYRFYRYGCGRDARLKAIWGS
jgi:peptide-methionine (S)-S-oxide reductase